MREQKCLKVCETCPWLKKNHGKKHAAGWYTLTNLKRLWNGLRTGKARGMICHASDINQGDYGGTAKIKPGTEKRDCAGAMLALGKHIEEINACSDKPAFEAYKKRYALPVTRNGLLVLLDRQLTGDLPAVENRMDEIGLPWDRD